MSEIGHNVAPDYAATITDRLEQDYAELTKGAQALLEEARLLPKEITSDEEMGPHATLIERMRDTSARIESFRVVEKEPHMRASQAVDQFFFGWFEKLARRAKTGKPGAADILQARVNDYMQRKLDAERRARAAAEAAARAAEEALRKEREEAARKAAEAHAAAERARKAENIKAHELRAAEEAAKAAQLAAEQARAAEAADDARIDTLAKPADMVRTRLEGGPMVTMRQVPVVVIEEVEKLDMAKLWPHLKEEHILTALKAWAKTTGYKKQMAGATIKMVDEAVVR